MYPDTFITSSKFQNHFSQPFYDFLLPFSLRHFGLIYFFHSNDFETLLIIPSKAQGLHHKPDTKGADRYELTCSAPLVTLGVEEVAYFWFICRELKHTIYPRPFHLCKEWFGDNSKPLVCLRKVIYFIFLKLILNSVGEVLWPPPLVIRNPIQSF